MAAKSNPRSRAGDTGAGKIGMRDSADNTQSTTINQDLIAFRLTIEQDRRTLAKELALVYAVDPAAAVSCRHVLRDLRLLGAEIGRLAWGRP
jgi:hypothetical protein